MHVVLAGLLLLLCCGCGDDGGVEGQPLALYHLETAIGGPGDEGELRCGPPRIACPGVVEQPPPRTYRYAVRARPALTDEHVIRSTARRRRDPVTGAPGVSVALTPAGTAAFAQVTRDAARVGGRDQAWHHLAIVVGGEIVAYPQVDYDVFPDGIADAPAIQIPAASDGDAADLVARLTGGYAPARTRPDS